jgi:ribosomal protein L20
MMIQTTVGCRFRCDFCDIIQFNGGFTRPKTVESVRDELEAIRALGHRGGVFTVDDNFVGNPDAIEIILHEMIEFQRRHDYPFSFYTQASLDLGSEKLAHLLPLMKQAGFEQVFLGIENPDPAGLKGMNKKQNTKVDIARTVATIQAAGIEVMAGFIFGGDEDTPDTARAIATFAEATAIPTAMTGMLTPIPYTPLTERLRAEGRLMEAEFSGNNTDDEVQFVPRHMTADEMRAGYYLILEQLFSSGAMYRRAGKLLERLRPHIFRGKQLRKSDMRAAFRSLWRQGVVRSSRGEYAKLLLKGLRLDQVRMREASRALAELERADLKVLTQLVDRAREAVVRAETTKTLRDAAEWASSIKQRIEQGTPTAEDIDSLRRWAGEYFRRQAMVHRFPGAYLVKAFDLAIKGLHYETVMTGIVRRARQATPEAGGFYSPNAEVMRAT